MTDEAQIKRTLKIKAGVVTRLTKEHVSYLSEVHDLETKYEQFLVEREGVEEWDIKNTYNIREETKKVADQTRDKLKQAVYDLKSFLDSVGKGDRRNIKSELDAAIKALEDAESLVPV